ncbi:hypothetical protein D9M68_968470 [compost metagenome]
MAGSAGAGAAAFRLDARHRIADGVLHDGRAVFGFHVEACAIEGEKGKLGHYSP